MESRMRQHRRPLTAKRFTFWAALLGGLLFLCLLVGATLGAGQASLLQLLPGGRPLGEVERAILVDVRLPRVLLAALLGGALSMAGVVFQALLRNPLADPYILGVSGGASIGGVLALLFGLGGTGAMLGGLGVPLLAFCGALAALLLIEWIATVGGRLTVYTVLLTGAIFNAFSAALIYFIQSIASLEQLHAIVFYLMGRVPSLAGGALGLLAAAILLTSAILCGMSRDYNALTLGEEGALQLGVEVERIKRRTFVLGSLLTALTVSVAGMIGFVGLVVPHMLRLLFGPDHRLLLPAAFLGGASFLVLADTLSRLLIAPNELPVGVVTALVGGPFFLWLLRRRGKSHGFV
jgi:iron complex transport system permease protein